MPKTVEELQAELTRVQADFEQYTQALEQQLTENEQLKAKLAELEPFQAQTTELQGKLRSLSHERAFEKLAEDLGIRPEAVKDVWDLAKYEAKADEPDEKALREHIGKFLESPERKKLYTQDGGGTKRLSKGEGAERGGGKEPDPRPKFTREQMSDPEWCFKHQEAFAKSMGEGNAPQLIN